MLQRVHSLEDVRSCIQFDSPALVLQPQKGLTEGENDFFHLI